MKRFNFFLDATTRQKIEADMKATGHVSIATFIRHILFLFPFSSTLKWTDDDMVDFATKYSEAKKVGEDSEAKFLITQYKRKQ